MEEERRKEGRKEESKREEGTEGRNERGDKSKEYRRGRKGKKGKEKKGKGRSSTHGSMSRKVSNSSRVTPRGPGVDVPGVTFWVYLQYRV